MTIDKSSDQQFWELCNAHDYSFHYSDDHSMWKRGEEQIKRIKEEAAITWSKATIFKEWTETWKAWLAGTQKDKAKPPYPLQYVCDNARHMICTPYSIENLHRMASCLGLSRRWFHKKRFPHYDMPKRRSNELISRCLVVRQRDILMTIKEAQGGKAA